MDNTLTLSMPTVDLVFGLEWYPLIGARPDRLARRIARQRGASHMVLANEAAAAVGVGTLGKSRRRKPLHSAAQNLAHLFGSGTTAVLMDLGEGRHWLAAVHEGAVVARTDRLYAAQQDAMHVLEELHQAYPQMRVLDSAATSSAPTLNALEAACVTASRLSALRRWPYKLPWPLPCFAAVLVLALCLPKMRSLPQRSPEPPPGGINQAVLAARLWHDAVAQAIGTQVVHGIGGTHALLDVFHQLPVEIDGWRLQQAECMAAGAAWQCRTRYWRAGREANNAGFIAGAPPAWAVGFASLEQAEGSWLTAPHGLPLARLRLASSADTEQRLFSALQALRPGFANIHFGKPAPVLTASPKDGQGRVPVRPADLHMPLHRPVHISGPLRSASLLPPLATSMSWNRAILTLGEQARPAVASSRLTLTLQGVLYETENQLNASGSHASTRPGAIPVTQDAAATS